MKLLKYACLSMCSVLLLTASADLNDPLNIGDRAPLLNQRVVDTSGRTVTLNETANRNGLMVIFTCNTCPWVTKWENRYNSLASLAGSNGIGVIALNPNERIRNRGESMDDMKKRSQKQDYNFPYALDKDHKIADAFGATRTPEVFLFDSNLQLVYHGAIDDNADNASQVESAYAEEAINALIAGNQIENEKTRSLGCTIKRSR